MARNTYVAKDRPVNECKVLLPATQLGRATRTSFQSFRLQLERHDANALVSEVRLDEFSGMQRISLFVLDNQDTEPFSDETTVGVLIEQLHKIEKWLMQHAEYKVIPRLEDGQIYFDKEKPGEEVVSIEEREKRLLLIK